MTKLWRLLMASTVLPGFAGLGTVHAANNLSLPKPDEAAPPAIILAQANTNPDEERRRRQNQNQNQNNQRQNQNQNQNQNNQRQQNQQQDQRRQERDQRRDQQQQQNQQQRQERDQRRDQQQQQRQDQRQQNQQQQDQRRQDQQRQEDQRRQEQEQRRQQQNQQQDQRRQDQQRQEQQRRQEQEQRRQQQNQQQDQRRQEQQQQRDNRNQQNNRNQQDNRNQGGQQGNQGGQQGNQGGGNTTDRSRDPVSRSGIVTPKGDEKAITSRGAGKGVAVETANGRDIRSVDQLRTERKVVKEGNRTLIREPDRTIIKEGNRTFIRHDEGNRFRVGARDVRFERRGNDNVQIVFRPGGERIVTVLDGNGYLLRRSRFLPDGREIIIIDNRRYGGYRPGNYFVVLPPPVIRIPRDRYIVVYRNAPPPLLYATLMAPPVDRIERPYSLDEIRYSAALRDRMPRIDLDTVTFESGSWELTPDQIDKLGPIADAMKQAIDQNPQVVFLIEGYTDAVGNEDDNLSLSDRRAESVAVALTEQFGVPPENMSTQGYGEQFPKIPTQGPEEANRRVTVRNVAPLLAGQNMAGPQ